MTFQLSPQGPTVGDATTFADAVEILKKYKITPPPAVEKHLREAQEEKRSNPMMLA